MFGFIESVFNGMEYQKNSSEVNNVKRLLITLCVPILLIGSCSESDEQQVVRRDKYILKVGHSLPPAHPVHLSLLHMAELLDQKSNGKIELRIYPSNSAMCNSDR